MNKIKQSVYITPLSTATLTLRQSKPSFFSYLRLFSPSRRLYIFVLLDTLSLHSWWRVTWAKVALRAINPIQALKWTQKKYILKQRKYEYFTSHKLWSPKFKNRFYKKKPSHHKEYLAPKYSTSQLVIFTKLLNKFLF